MRVSSLQDTGVEERPEDSLFIGESSFVVADGMSDVYYPGGRKERPLRFGEMTGGKYASSLLASSVGAAQGWSLRERILRTNVSLGASHRKKGLSLEDPERLAGAVFAAAEISGKTTEIFHAGDCLAVWIDENHALGATRNLCFEVDMERRCKIAHLLKKHGGNRVAMWREFGPVLEQSRREHANKTYGVLNGQAEFPSLMEHFVLNDLLLLIMFSDGMIDYSISKSRSLLAEKVVSLYVEGGLRRILENARQSGVCEEATAIAIEF